MQDRSIQSLNLRTPLVIADNFINRQPWLRHCFKSISERAAKVRQYHRITLNGGCHGLFICFYANVKKAPSFKSFKGFYVLNTSRYDRIQLYNSCVKLNIPLYPDRLESGKYRDLIENRCEENKTDLTYVCVNIFQFFLGKLYLRRGALLLYKVEFTKHSLYSSVGGNVTWVHKSNVMKVLRRKLPSFTVAITKLKRTVSENSTKFRFIK